MKRKKTEYAIILLLALIITASFCACGAEGSTDGTSVTDDMTELTVTTKEPETSEAPITQIEIIFTPDSPEELGILISAAANGYDVIVPEDGVLSKSRADMEGMLLDRYGVTLKKDVSVSVADDIKNGVLTGSSEYAAMHIAFSEGLPLMLSGMLQNLSEGGIGIGPETFGVNRGLTSELMFGTGVYLLFCDGLSSAYGASYVIGADCSDESVRNAVLAAAQDYISKGFTLEDTLKLVSDLKTATAKDVLSVGGSEGMLAALAGFDGRIFVRDSSGLPSANVKSEEFSSAYGAVIRLRAESGQNAPLKIAAVSSVPEGSAILPLPKLSPDRAYRTFTDTGRCSVIAAPAGLENGSNFAQYVGVVGRCADETVVAAGMMSMTEKSPLPAQTAERITGIIIGGMTTDTALAYGWADLGNFVLAGLSAGTDAKTLLGERNLDSRIKTVGTAASIYYQRMH